MKKHMHETPPASGDAEQMWQELLAAAQARPWLLHILRDRAAALYLRFRAAYARLRQTRPGQLRHMQRRLGLGLAGAALLLALSGSPVYADSITVNGDGTAGTCSLADAIAAANTNATVNNCTHSGASGADTITLGVDVSLTSALPDISTPITINGGGHTIQRTGGSGFSVLKVTSTGNLTLNSATISGGSTTYGGGLYNHSGTVMVQNSTVSGNSASGFAGGIYNKYGVIIVQNSTVSGNSAAGFFGGGIQNFFATLTVQNSTISGNSASSGGGGIYNGPFAITTVQNSTVSGNTANNYGGGIANFAGTVTVQNSIIANSTGSDCTNTGAFSGSYSLIEDGSNACGLTNGTNGNIVGQDPSLGAGFIPNGDSPAIDAGNPAAPGSGGSACFAADKRGQARDDLRCDMGALEVKLADHDTIIKNIGGAGTFTFGPTLAKIVVTTQGSLSQLQVQHHSGNHIGATGPDAQGDGTATGQWWDITPTGSGFTADLDLPHSVTPDSNAKVCKYVSGTTWDCDRSGSTASRVNRDGLTAFSNWAVGQNVNANAVNLLDFEAAGGSGGGLTALWAGALAGLAGIGLGLRRRLGRGQKSEVRDRSFVPSLSKGSELRPEPVEVVGWTLAQADAETVLPDSTYPFDKRLTSPLRMYHPPAIVQRGALKQFAGSPLAPEPDDPLDILGLGN